jgi:Ulp1 family protease
LNRDKSPNNRHRHDGCGLQRRTELTFNKKSSRNENYEPQNTNSKVRRKIQAQPGNRNNGTRQQQRQNTSLLTKPIRIQGPTHADRGSVVLNPDDTREMLKFGSLLNDNVVQGYLNLLAVKFMGLGVRIVVPSFYPKLLADGWDAVQTWVQESESMDTNWETAPIILVPIFTGSLHYGHWSGLIVDRRIQIGSTGIRVYHDSLPPTRARALRTTLSNTPLIDTTSPWVTATTPEQHYASNACGAWMCCSFAVYLKATLEQTIIARGTSVENAHVTMEMKLENGLSSREWGRFGRQHIHDSFLNGTINLDDRAITGLTVSISAVSTRT